MLNLKLVTWEGDLTQFLVDVPTCLLADDAKKRAIEKAIGANLQLGDCGEEIVEDIYDFTTYTVEDVDFTLLAEIFERNDIIGLYNEAIVFND